MSGPYIESDLSPSAANVHRALASVQEELEAVDYYHQRADRTSDEALKAVLLHNRNEEIEHASMLLEWLRRNLPEFDTTLRTYLFTQAPITDVEAAGAVKRATPATADGTGLGIGTNLQGA
jgi:ferritin-like protein